MAAGDETIMGPYDNNAAGWASAGADLDTNYVDPADKYVVLMGAGNMQFTIIQIDGA